MFGADNRPCSVIAMTSGSIAHHDLSEWHHPDRLQENVEEGGRVAGVVLQEVCHEPGPQLLG